MTTASSSDPSERILVLGAGIAGLSAALALGDSGAQVTVLEQDEPPGHSDPDEAFGSWKRPGVTHLRHSHVFLARLYNLIRDRYPELLEALLDAGCRELRFADGLPAHLRSKYRPAPEDDEFTILSGRRTTLELVLRDYVECLGQVEIRSDTAAVGLIVEGVGDDGPAIVRGVITKSAHGGSSCDQSSRLEADVVIDATGKRTPIPGWLVDAGVDLVEEDAPAGILYFTRHYRRRPGIEEPVRGDLPGNGDLGYVKFAVFPADRGCFSITLATLDDERELRREIMKPESFDAICSRLPGVARWTDPERAEPTTKVFGMGELSSHWKHFVAGDRPLVLGLFAIGDAIIRSNPLYGRGCSSSAVQAHLLADVLRQTADPGARALLYDRALRREIRPHYDSMVRQDRQAIRRAHNQRDPDYRPTLRQRWTRSFVEQGLVPASRGNLTVLRALLHGFHMLEDPALAPRRPAIMLRILSYWVRPRPLKRHLQPPSLGPERALMFQQLGIGEL